MLLMMAWIFWYFCAERQKKKEQDIDLNEVENILDITGLKDVIEETCSEERANINNKDHTKNNEIVEENINISFINFQSENPIGFPNEEEILPSTIAFDEYENDDFNNFDAATDDDIDYEISTVFMVANDDEVMKASLMKNRMSSIETYQGEVSEAGSASSSSSTKLNIHTNTSIDDTASGRIHSIVVPKHEEKHNLRIRSTSPMICIHPENSVHEGHEGHKGYEGTDREEDQQVEENLINPENISFSNSSPDSDEYIITPIEESSDQLSSASKQHDVDTKQNPGKLKKKTHHKHVEPLAHSPSAKLTDFETVMKSRKLHTDTMDITANVLGNLGHRKEKIKGTINKKVSRNWEKLQQAVMKRQFVNFKNIPLSSDSSE